MTFIKNMSDIKKETQVLCSALAFLRTIFSYYDLNMSGIKKHRSHKHTRILHIVNDRSKLEHY